MPFAIHTGVYTPAAGATNATTGQVIQSAIWNSIHADLSSALTALAQGSQPLLCPMSFHNVLNRNGSFDIWQRGAGSSASITITGAATVYTADGWYFVSGANQTCNASAQAALVNGSLLSGQFQRNSGSTGVTALTLGFPLDTDEVDALCGHMVALSFVAKTGANWSPTVGLVVNVFTGTAAPTKQVNGYSGQAAPISTTVAMAASATTTVQLTGSAAVGAAITQAEVQLSWTPVGTAGAADWVQLDDVQLETNLAPTQYDRIPFDVCLARSMRHYQKTFNYTVAPAQAAGTVGAIAALIPVANSAGQGRWDFNPPLRAAPSVTTYSPTSANADWRNITGSADVVPTVDANTLSPQRALIYSATVAAASSLLAIHAQADAGI